jgi:hypothetical protein
MPDEERRKFPGDLLNCGLAGEEIRLLKALLLLFSKSFSLPGLLPAAWKAAGAWKLIPS